MDKNLYEKFEYYLYKNKLIDDFLDLDDATIFDDFSVLQGVYIEDYWEEYDEIARKHNYSRLQNMNSFEKSMIHLAVEKLNSRILETNIAEYLRKRELYVDNENNVLFLYVDFKDAAGLNEIDDVAAQFVRKVFKETYEKFKNGWYDVSEVYLA